MNEDCLKLMTYFGERDRANGRYLADALLAVYERHNFRASILLRGTEGFGIKHRLQTHRLLTLSEDLPLVTVAVDTRERTRAPWRRSPSSAAMAWSPWNELACSAGTSPPWRSRSNCTRPPS